MQYIFATERLLLRQFAIGDTAFIIRLLNSAGWLEFIGDRNVKTEEQAKNYLLNGPIKSYKENGFGLWLVALKDDQTPIGMCGLVKRNDLANPDIGFAFLPEFYNLGYAFEAANATLNFAKSDLKLPVVLGITKPQNKKSIKLLEKIGLKFKETIQFPDTTEPVFLFTNESGDLFRIS